jgi:hypothetical protein
MSKKSAALKSNFKVSVKTLLKAPALMAQKAMLIARFSVKDSDNKVMQRKVMRSSMKTLHPSPCPISVTCASQSGLIMSPLTGNNSLPIAACIQEPPKCKQQRMTASALQQKQVEDLQQKRHKVEAHKTAVQL